MSRPRFGRAVLTVSAGQAAAGVAKALIPLVVARRLEPDSFGVYSITVTLILLAFNVGCLGTPAATTYEVSRGRWSTAVTSWNSVVMSVGLGCVAAVVGGTLAIALGGVFDLELGTGTVLLGVTAVPSYFVVNGLLGYFLGREDHRRYNQLSVGFYVVILAMTATAVARWPTADAAVAALSVGSMLTAVVGVAYAHRDWSGQRRLEPGYLRDATAFGLRSHASTVITFLNYRLDVLLVGILLGTSAVGAYAAAVAVAELVWFLSQVASWVLFARVAGDDHPVRRRSVTEATARLVLWTSAAVALVIALVAGPLVRQLYGDEFATAAPALRLLLIGVVLLGVSRVLANYVAAVGHPARNIPGSLAALVIGIVLNLALVPPFGIRGAALASTVAYAGALVHRLWVYRSIDGVNEPWLRFLAPRRSDISVARASLRRHAEV